MKRFLFVTAIVFVFSLSAFGQKAAAGRVDPTKSVHDVFDRLIDGIKQVDVDKVMSSYEKSDRLLIFNNNGSATIGWENIKDNVTSSYAKVANVTLDVTGLRIEMLGKTAAYVTCKWKQTQENDGKLENASGRMTLVFKLLGKDWKIVHRHTSPDKPDAIRPVFPSEREN
ncbi:MAG: nuclear transport factor 2 family protein [Pyrinomonadaceae bacterium]